ncbi:hypothetical protein [Tenacibaculum mesophilum]|uniref:hypothetical protein n=1 Tax=Tenacibaculum mesophilum TaxID=104268 RepID=UPI00064A50B4|nr:hypothetical protein [Tenacibaculum mesophilum]
MISYNFDYPTSEYRGGVSPKSFQMVTTAEDTFNQTFDKTVNMIDPTGLVSTVLDTFGIGPRKWPEVQKYEDSEWQGDLNFAINKYLKDNSLSPEERLTAFDRWVSSYRQYNVEIQSRFKASNSINGRKYRITQIDAYLQSFRNAQKTNYVLTPKTEDVRKYNHTNRRYTVKGSSLNPWLKQPVTYMVYSVKPRTKTPVKPVEVTGKPVTDVGTDIPTNDVNIPTDAPYFEDKPKENEGSFNWLFVIIPVAVIGLWKLGEYLFKNKKKKK